MKTISILAILLIVALGLAGCKAVNPYPIMDDATFGTGNEENILGSQSNGLSNIAPQANRPQMPAQQRQVVPKQVVPTTPPATTETPNGQQAEFPKKVNPPSVNIMRVTTSRGEIVISLFPQDAPETIANYQQKADSGFYNNLTFHRVEDWVVQGGDPKGDGTGGGTIPTELTSREFKEGSVGVARGGDIKVSNDSQFFVCISDCNWLTGKYTLFGEVSEGLDVAKSIQRGDTITSVKLE